MTELRRRMLEDMQLQGLSERTRQLYVYAVHMLAKHYHRPPEQLTEEKIRQFFLYLIRERQASNSTLQVYLAGIKFFYEKTLHREWPVLNMIRAAKRKKLPVVLSVEEVRSLLGMVRIPRNRMCLTTIYSCGLRLSEGVNLKVTDIDSNRMVVWIRAGKGGKDRCIPLPQRTLDLLRIYWNSYHPRLWLFPVKDGTPITPRAIQRCWLAVIRASGLKKSVTVHTLRHCYATHLLENGVDIRVIQALLGHQHLTSTVIYTHLTKKTVTALQNTLDGLMADL